ncbi:MAG: nucleoid-associated protein [Prevotella sp.]|uniref:nucleoid-associated protein n=1 Tax=Prevotella sp. PTAC TaxID=2736295 RepID=UPI0015570248|nr:nucleoid-associated protein [Prevotella sp. PTAC]MCX4292855.1 nucleoid-associated protein [Prevotella sp.]NPD54256.1 nucleoid-associated protein [Prevotella sp. PTAC]
MIQFNNAEIQAIALHKVGNKYIDEPLVLSKNLVDTDDLTKEILSRYFLSKFNFVELYVLSHQIDLKYNEVYSIADRIFKKGSICISDTIDLAKHLYEQSVHPKIKGGEFYIVYFEDCIIDEKRVNAIGLFKSENKDTFLKIYPKGDSFEIESEKGININRLDKGCLIFNVEKEKGYVVAIVDNVNKGSEAKYWTEDFLHIRSRKDSFNQTQNMLSLCKSFVSQLPSDNGKVEKATYMNRSVEALKEESVNVETFAEQVFETPELVSEFKQYKESYQKERDIEIDDSFATASNAIKRRATGTMTTIKLDKNFDINIHGGEQYIKRGYDEKRKMHYYQLFFKEEK